MVLDCFVVEMPPIAISSKGQFVDKYGLLHVNYIFPNSPYEPHKLTCLVLHCVVANCENHKHRQSITNNTT